LSCIEFISLSISFLRNSSCVWLPLFSLRVALVEQFQQCLVVGFNAQKNVFGLLGGSIVVSFLQLPVHHVCWCFGVVDKCIELEGVSRPPDCPAPVLISQYLGFIYDLRCKLYASLFMRVSIFKKTERDRWWENMRAARLHGNARLALLKN
jgi:hypothetical protein